MDKLRWLPFWKLASSNADRGMLGRVVEKHWNGKNTYGDGDIVNESFRLLVERFDTEVGIVLVSPLQYIKTRIGEDVELALDKSA